MGAEFQTTTATPVQSFTLSHLVGHLAVSPREQHLVAYSPENSVISVFFQKGECRQVDLGQPTGGLCMAVDDSGTLIAFARAGDDCLQLRNLDSMEHRSIQHASEVVDARFDRMGRLWTVRRDIQGYVVEMRAARSWELVSQAEVGDKYFRQGGAEFRAATSNDAMIVELYSGHGEQQNYQLEVGDRAITARHLSILDGFKFLFASQNGSKVVILDHETCSVECFEPPYCEPFGGLPWPDYIEGESEDERPGYYGCHINADYFLAGSSEGRLFLFDLSPLGVKKEIQIAGHLPVPAAVKYPSLSDATGMVSDLTVFGRCGETVIAFFASNNGTRPEVAIIPIREILGAD